MAMLKRCVWGFLVILPILFSTMTTRAADIVDKISRDGQFTILLRLFRAAGLDDILKSKGPFTLFAPTDEAFGNLPGGMVEQLLEPENKKLLRALLRYHVLPGKTLRASRIIEVGNFDFKTLEGSRAEIDTRNGPHIETARILQADIMTENGIVHVIDAVMLPPRLKKLSQ